MLLDRQAGAAVFWPANNALMCLGEAMFKRAALPVLSLAGVLLVGCVSVKSYNIPSPPPASGIPVGAIPYTLAKTTFAVTDTYTLDCQDADGKGNITIKQSIAVTPQNVGDPKESYYILPSDLYDGFKDSKITINLNANQTLSSINGTVNDLVGPTIAAAIGTAISTSETVGLAGIKLGGFDAHGAPIAPVKCSDALNPDTMAALTKVAALKKEVKALQAADKPARAPAGAAASAPAPSDPAVLADTNQIADITATKLTLKASLVWDPKPGDPLDIPLDGSAVVQAAWFQGDPIVTTLGFKSLVESAHLAPHIALSLYPSSHPISTAEPEHEDGAKGFVIRVPALATVRVCQSTCSLWPSTTFVDLRPVLFQADNVAVGQFGPRLIVPFKDHVFENATISLTLAADGSLTSIGTQQTSTANTFVTALGTAAQAQATSAAATNTAIGQRNTAQQALAGYPDLVNKSLADCLSQQKTIISLGGTPPAKCQ